MPHEAARLASNDVEVAMRIAFCGMGLMGAPMAVRLVEAGHEVTVWNRTPDKARPVADRGASRADTPGQAADEADVVITMLADRDALEEVVRTEDGLASALSAGQTFLEMSTVGVEAVRTLRDWVPEGVEVVDAPVLGSVPQATDGTLKVFVGATPEAFERLRPLLEVFGSPRLMGPFGSGAAMKLVVNATLPALMTALGESLLLADALGLDQSSVLDVLGDSAIGVTVKSKRSRIESGEYPPNFKLDLALKDAGLVNDAAMAAGVQLRLAPAAREWLADASAAGMGDLDYSAVLALIRGKPAKHQQ
jgi:3-hydroxyisobutyrate dehydrogenase-like beta-hydroxyacid dehydrogenase